MTLTDVAHKVIDGWMIDRRISIPAILAVLSVATTAAFFLSDMRNEGRSNTKEIATLKEELVEQRAYTRAIPQISERVGRLEATVAASVSRQELAFEEINKGIKAIITQGGPKNSAPSLRRP